MDSSDANLLAPSLRHFPDAEKDSDSLELLIQRLNVQRGHFRTVTEEELEKEIAEGKDDEEDDASVASASAESKDEDGEDTKTVDEIYAAKAEMFTLIAYAPTRLQQARPQADHDCRQAQNEALLALDFISLLLSKDAPNQGRQTMSQALTQLVPPGTLGYDKWPVNEPSAEEKESERAVTLGWQVTSIENSADSLAKAAQRLQKGVQHEQTYWDELLAIAERGYAVARIHPTRQRHIFGAQVGFMDGECYIDTLEALLRGPFVI
jgi:mediator of RNA polymerase II transcription subunit 17, fungi type